MDDEQGDMECSRADCLMGMESVTCSSTTYCLVFHLLYKTRGIACMHAG
jgi:hypothetical protein